MVATVAAIEVTGWAGKLLLLLPIVVLLIVILRLEWPRRSKKKPKPENAIQRAIPDGALPTAARHQPESEPLPPAPESVAIVDWAERVRTAEAGGDHAALPGLYLSFAKYEITQGRTDTAGDHLRSSVRLAAKAKNASVHAEARIELAELARAAGDLTTACEHWQIAKGLFRSLSLKSELEHTERLMQRHGCPTDWVLNDF